jgi:soluble P-type ATPase
VSPTPTDGSADKARGVVAFDNSGTLSEPVVEGAAVSDDARTTPVPDIPPERPTALASIALDEYTLFDEGRPLGRVVAAADIPITLALSNVETTREAVRDAVVADGSVPARAVTERFERLVDRVHAEYGLSDPPVGVQLVVDLDAGRIHRVFAYTTVPRPVAADVVALVRSLGYDPHIVSGDATQILGRVASEVAVDESNVHPYQSAADKAATVTDLARTEASAVMVGDYVNDRFAFEAADVGILVTADREPHDGLVDRADATVERIEDVPGVLSSDDET